MAEIRNQLAIQLYSLRNELQADYEGIIRKVAEMGYKYVEPAGFPGTTLDQAVKFYQDLGLVPYSCHGKLPVGDDKQEAIETALKLGAKYIVSGKGGNSFADSDSIKKVAEEFTIAAENAAEHGLCIGYHNHNWEMNIIDGLPGYKIFMDNTPASVTMQLDTYWVKVGGLDPVAVIEEVGERARLLHIKDGDIDPPKPMTAVGAGKMDFPPIIKAAKFAELLIVELDECGTDMTVAVEESFNYLKSIV